MNKRLRLIVCLALLIGIALGGTAALTRDTLAIYRTSGPVLPLPLPPVEDDPPDPPDVDGFPGYWITACGPVLPLPLPPVEDDPPDPPDADGFPGYRLTAGPVLPLPLPPVEDDPPKPPDVDWLPPVVILI